MEEEETGADDAEQAQGGSGHSASLREEGTARRKLESFTILNVCICISAARAERERNVGRPNPRYCFAALPAAILPTRLAGMLAGRTQLLRVSQHTHSSQRAHTSTHMTTHKHTGRSSRQSIISIGSLGRDSQSTDPARAPSHSISMSTFRYLDVCWWCSPCTSAR